LPPPTGKIHQLVFYFGINQEILEENYSGGISLSNGNFFPLLRPLYRFYSNEIANKNRFRETGTPFA
jgi:hypothetical protein